MVQGISASKGHAAALLRASRTRHPNRTRPPHTALTIPPTSGGGTSTEPHDIANNGISFIFAKSRSPKLTIRKSIVKLRHGIVWRTTRCGISSKPLTGGGF